jgi:hypothetical protein
MREQIAKDYEVKVAATCEEMEAYKQSFERSCEQRVAKAKQEYIATIKVKEEEIEELR